MGFFTHAFIRNIGTKVQYRARRLCNSPQPFRDIGCSSSVSRFTVNKKAQTSCTLVRCAPVSDPTKRHGRGRPDRRPCPPLGVRPGASPSGCVYPSCCRGRGKYIVRALTAPLRRPLTLIKRTSTYYQNHKPPHEATTFTLRAPFPRRAAGLGGLTKYKVLIYCYSGGITKAHQRFLVCTVQSGSCPSRLGRLRSTRLRVGISSRHTVPA